jgi:hypothetical protein
MVGLGMVVQACMTVSQPAELLRNNARDDIPSTALQYKQCIWVPLLTMWQLPGAKTVAFNGLASASAVDVTLALNLTDDDCVYNALIPDQSTNSTLARGAVNESGCSEEGTCPTVCLATTGAMRARPSAW